MPELNKEDKPAEKLELNKVDKLAEKPKHKEVDELAETPELDKVEFAFTAVVLGHNASAPISGNDVWNRCAKQYRGGDEGDTAAIIGKGEERSASGKGGTVCICSRRCVCTIASGNFVQFRSVKDDGSSIRRCRVCIGNRDCSGSGSGIIQRGSRKLPHHSIARVTTTFSVYGLVST